MCVVRVCVCVVYARCVCMCCLCRCCCCCCWHAGACVCVLCVCVVCVCGEMVCRCVVCACVCVCAVAMWRTPRNKTRAPAVKHGRTQFIAGHDILLMPTPEQLERMKCCTCHCHINLGACKIIHAHSRAIRVHQHCTGKEQSKHSA